MPLVRIQLAAGKSEAYRRALVEGIYAALRQTFDVPEEDLFMQVEELAAGNFHFSRSYLGISRSDDLVILQLTVSNTRPLAKKQALYKAIVANLGQNPGLRPQDVFINLVEVAKENWSFGHGEAQYV
ncbi:MAG: tautomerase family protein [Hyphomicrobiaceae bacterium]|nr:tautomerase family protein [Hyphomicrobiaceae bacterium]